MCYLCVIVIVSTLCKRRQNGGADLPTLPLPLSHGEIRAIEFLFFHRICFLFCSLFSKSDSRLSLSSQPREKLKIMFYDFHFFQNFLVFLSFSLVFFSAFLFL